LLPAWWAQSIASLPVSPADRARSRAGLTGREAIDWAHHAGRRTVKARDIEKASGKLLGEV
ncbi:hypothetical protein DRO56_03670, partial [Candidatus Bathyarchaeota archaeon]